MAGSFVYSLVCGLVSARKHTKKNAPDGKKRKRRSDWFSHTDRIRLHVQVTSDDKSLLIDESSADDSGYKSPTCLLSTTSVSVDDICDIYRLDDTLDKPLDDDDDGDMLRKASSLSSLLRCTSIQDKSLRLMRRRRQNMAKRRSKLLYADEGIDLTLTSTCDDVTSTDDNISSDEASPQVKHLVDDALRDSRGDLTPCRINIDGDVISRSCQVGVARNSSVQMKSWEIRRRRKLLLRKRKSRSCDELGSVGYELSYGSVGDLRAVGYELSYGSVGDLRAVDSKASRQMKVRSFYI
ncbi:uncharacterized protein LOC121381810 [Gigantopelta aegis]|uniref:uncharacterized protein LOC121381810 n=1 Tax=Gigantopelta aegis TaxID=1735272 RepID=UPI001B889065|nr:uncharacterized protein LOC121381810 [Gigantopelta aegis]